MKTSYSEKHACSTGGAYGKLKDRPDNCIVSGSKTTLVFITEEGNFVLHVDKWDSGSINMLLKSGMISDYQTSPKGTVVTLVQE